MKNILEMTTADILALDAEDLCKVQADVENTEALAKEKRAAFDEAIQVQYADSIEVAFRNKGDMFGQASFDDGAFTVSVNRPKRVDWDQDILATVIRSLEATNEDPTEYVTTKHSVSESKWKSWPSSIKDQFRDARTTKMGKMKVTIG